MRRWVRGLPVILIGILAATATTTTRKPRRHPPARPCSRAPPPPIAATSSSGDLEARLIGDDAIVVDPGAVASAIVRRHEPQHEPSTHGATLDRRRDRAIGRRRSVRERRVADRARELAHAVGCDRNDRARRVGARVVHDLAARRRGSGRRGRGPRRADRSCGASLGQPRSAASAIPSRCRSRSKSRARRPRLVSIARVTAVKDDGHEYLEITFQNSGATANTMVGQVSVLGAHPRSESVKAVVAPLTHTNVRVPFAMPRRREDGAGVGGDTRRRRRPGVVERRGRFHVRGVGFGRAGPVASRRARAAASAPVPHASSIPWPAPVLVLVALLAAAIWLVAEVRRSRRRRVAMILASAQSGVVAPAVPAMYAPDPVWSAARRCVDIEARHVGGRHRPAGRPARRHAVARADTGSVVGSRVGAGARGGTGTRRAAATGPCRRRAADLRLLGGAFARGDRCASVRTRGHVARATRRVGRRRAVPVRLAVPGATGSVRSAPARLAAGLFIAARVTT